MTHLLLHYEPIIRLSGFAAMLALMMLWEWRQPRRVLNLRRTQRWPANLGIIVVDSVVVRLVFPVLAVGVAGLAEARGWGLFHWLPAPLWLAGIASLLLLDLAIYAQHVLFHKAPLLWRLHRMHHSDLDFDVTTALRFHPLEIVLSMLIKLGVVVALGAPPVVVMLFEVILNATAMFNHGNVHLPERLDRGLRWLLVTPDMHRVHHSIYPEETNSNFGFNLPWWDRLFGTYREQPGAGHIGMIIGLESFRDQRATGLMDLLLQPFLNAESSPSNSSRNLVLRK
ncbi:sterol desaturase family protein [Candidatus Contendibacter odensensis]|uniref:Sterol desaturase-like protein n=1 Tax=Candidatus Contendobacter odensis Run_B_J11 TaxID=1400861 RepID=A0A7U7GFN8_9GAMM|nr:sterol desaturase family protein [Candidatus Contendobacter odensis]CDH47250.1 Sterol desaturase-like protein [Candidatus Contendobacter odensis Run_B_J11]